MADSTALLKQAFDTIETWSRIVLGNVSFTLLPTTPDTTETDTQQVSCMTSRATGATACLAWAIACSSSALGTTPWYPGH